MMKNILPILSLSLLITGCKAAYQADEQALLQNPLYLETYAEQMVETMVGLEIYEDPIVQDAEKKKIIDETKQHWFAFAQKARAQQRQGSKGSLITMKHFAEGEVLYKDEFVHFSPHFSTVPGPDLHVYLSKTVDPRDVLFPDESAIDLGVMNVPYGAQSFILPKKQEKPVAYRTVVLWDNTLERLYAFAQISPMN